MVNSRSFLIIGGGEEERLKFAKNIAPEAIPSDAKGIDDIRGLERLISSSQSVIINNAQDLTPEAQNAFLKTLEEPPENTVIILLAPNEESLLPTVVSRCFIQDLGNLSNSPISAEEKKQFFAVLGWAGEGDIKNGFAWSEKNARDRVAALELIDKLMVLASQNEPNNPAVIRKLFRAKKYLKANTNVRLTLENLFLKE